MIHLPDDIWHQIVGYITGTQLRKLFAVNRFFFNHVMDLVYREIRLTYLTSYSLRLLEHLKNDYVARRVRILTLSSHFTSPLVVEQEDNIVVPKRNSSALKKIKTCIDHITKRSKPSYIRHPFTGYEPSKAAADLARNLEEVLRKLKNIQEYNLVWNDEGTTDFFSVNPTCAQTWLAFGENLRKLNFITTAERLPRLLQAATGVCDLLSFDLTISAPHLNDGPMEVKSDWTDLASFLGRSTNRLESLSLQGKIFLPFDESTRFPRLKHLSLRVHLTLDPEEHSSNRIFRVHAEHLEELLLQQTYCTRHLCHCRTGGQNRDDIFRDLTFPSLKRLILHLSSKFTITPLLTLTRRACTTLQHLDFQGKPLDHDALERFADGFAETKSNSQLRYLSLKVAVLTKETIDVISRTFPSLYSLTLAVRSQSEDMAGFDSSVRFGLSLTAHGADYSGWKLYDITIYNADGYDMIAMKSVARHTPSVCSFYGSGSMAPKER